MASTTATLYIHPTAEAVMSAGRVTSATVNFSLRLLSGLITTSGVQSSRNLANLSSLLPHITQPMITAGRDGRATCDPQWYRFFDYLTNTFLSGASGPTLADIITSIVSAQESAAEAERQTLLVANQAQTNAEALSAAVQVVQTAALPGADQIPQVKRDYMEP